MLRTALYFIVRLFFAVFTRLEVQGVEVIPTEGAAILVSNHLGIMDAPLIFALLKRKDATSLVADTYQRQPFIRWVVNTVQGIWINREDADLHALRQARNFLQNGGLLGIAPEGTRSRTGVLMPAKTGAAYLADKVQGVRLIPAAIWGTEKLFSKLAGFHRPPVHVCIGEPFTLPPLERQDRSASLQRNTDEIMCRIAVMLPPEYRGVYADHPRLHELLSQ
jgi:1-acyl-sn-glycerol-3-phosphate acyltransferase